MALVIKKRISLEFLGEEYKDSYMLFRCVTLGEYDLMQGKDKDKTVRDVVTEHFISGQIRQDSDLVDITKDNLSELPAEVFVYCFNKLIGQPDPKPEGQ